MSPEQVRGEPADHRSDIFALGAVLYELLAGRRAFHGGSAVETMSAILTAEPAPLIAGDDPLLAPALDRIVRRCLAKEAGERYQSAKDVEFTLEEIRRSGGGSTTLENRRVPAGDHANVRDGLQGPTQVDSRDWQGARGRRHPRRLGAAIRRTRAHRRATGASRHRAGVVGGNLRARPARRALAARRHSRRGTRRPRHGEALLRVRLGRRVARIPPCDRAQSRARVRAFELRHHPRRDRQVAEAEAEAAARSTSIRYR